MKGSDVCLVSVSPETMAMLVGAGAVTPVVDGKFKTAIDLKKVLGPDDWIDQLLDAIPHGKPSTAWEILARMGVPTVRVAQIRRVLEELVFDGCLHRIVLPNGDAAYRHPSEGESTLLVARERKTVVQFLEQADTTPVNDPSIVGTFVLRQVTATAVEFFDMDTLL